MSKASQSMHPRHRSDCTEFFLEPHETPNVDLLAPEEVVQAIEQSAERSGRTFNAQMLYVVKLCRGMCPPAIEDDRTLEEWKALAAQIEFQLEKDEEWIPCWRLFKDRAQHTGEA